MNYLDLIIFVFLVIAFILGFKDGFIRKLIGSLGFFLGILFGILFASYAGNFIRIVTGMDVYFAEILGGFIIFLATMVVAAILKRVVHPFDKINNMVNRIVGGFVGTLQIMFFISAVFYLLNIFNLPAKETRETSFLYPLSSQFIPKSIEVVGKIFPGTKSSIKELIIDKDKKES
ncbi:MAG: CvpA family protein [Ignavibacteriaceae bacterium]|nr:CvpA family protein [Ignavibacteriaceae bacterium]